MQRGLQLPLAATPCTTHLLHAEGRPGFTNPSETEQQPGFSNHLGAPALGAGVESLGSGHEDLSQVGFLFVGVLFYTAV